MPPRRKPALASPEYLEAAHQRGFEAGIDAGMDGAEEIAKDAALEAAYATSASGTPRLKP